MNLLSAAGFGFFGGVVRAIIGLLKVSDVRLHFRWKYFLFTTIASGLIGMFAGLLVSSDYRITMLAGYAGIDAIEGIYKAQKGRWAR